ncbi:GGDEF domain-containing protein, partial [Klebsiella pneumoniae]|uniref:GGDEF domain-containing protein n=1 Tax=Klebsiella pneumoniae TaxID=573 RepID=UPI0019549835
FKEVNDRFGHDIGDALLRTVAERVRSTLRQPDKAYRLGGDEFVVNLEGLGASAEEAQSAVQAVADKLRQTLGEDFVFGPIRH